MPVTDISPAQARELQRNGCLLIDVREPEEWASGMAEGARPISKSELESQACHHLESYGQAAILICAGGKRSDACAVELSRQGYSMLYSVKGGTQAWVAAGLPVIAYSASDFDRRYARQMILPNVGREGQQKLSNSRVLIVGAGGLGSPCAFYLAAAGIGHITIVDDDLVDLSNLQRQILHKNSNIGQNKVNSAKSTLNDLNPTISIDIHKDRITDVNISNYLNNIDLVIDATDNFKTRYAISDACARHGTPWVYGAVHRFEGQVSLFTASIPDGRGLCYRCLFPESVDGPDAPNCTEAGVMGVAPGLIGVLQASEALKHILGIGKSLTGRLLNIDLLSMTMHDTQMQPDPECPMCGSNGGAGDP
jgi:molybdopterin/thiamine biosynthesis adenylyltransferase/rhodanese-related sulfurtransferase